MSNTLFIPSTSHKRSCGTWPGWPTRGTAHGTEHGTEHATEHATLPEGAPEGPFQVYAPLERYPRRVCTESYA